MTFINEINVNPQHRAELSDFASVFFSYSTCCVSRCCSPTFRCCYSARCAKQNLVDILQRAEEVLHCACGKALAPLRTLISERDLQCERGWLRHFSRDLKLPRYDQSGTIKNRMLLQFPKGENCDVVWAMRLLRQRGTESWHPSSFSITT